MYTPNNLFINHIYEECGNHIFFQRMHLRKLKKKRKERPRSRILQKELVEENIYHEAAFKAVKACKQDWEVKENLYVNFVFSWQSSRGLV